jgi:dTDP-4-dehydrorhamnose 3,5-epimerase
MILEGVKIKKIKRFSDDRGFFSEIIKEGEETFRAIKQTSYTETYPGVIKAFHWHRKQYDVWFPIKGSIQIVLYDLRKDSSTFNQTQVIYAGEDNPSLILIPPGVAHGYRVLGSQRAGLFYHTSEAYDPNNPDEERIPFDDIQIAFDWQTKNK